MKLHQKIFKIPAFLFIPFLLVTAFFLLGYHPTQAQEVPATSPPPSPLTDFQIPKIPGTTEGTNTHFEIADSQYFNIILDSSESIKVRLESIPEMVTMRIESASTSASTQLTFSGLPPNTTFYKYEDDYHNEVAFTTDGDGKYSYAQDISKPHFVFIQPRKSTKFIKDDATGGDCTTIGIWDAATKACTLTTDVFETIQIDSNNITLDGTGHTLTGTNTGNGVYVPGKVSVTVKNLSISNFAFGIVLQPIDFSTRNMSNFVTSNKISNNFFGIILGGASNNNLTNNIVSNNGIGINLSVADNNTFSNNTVTNNTSGGGGGIQFFNSNQNRLNNNISSNNAGAGIRVTGSSNVLDGNTVKFNGQDGISIQFAPNTTLTNNTASNNAWSGIFLNQASNSGIINNSVDGNNFYGMWIANSLEVTATNNIASNNRQIGIYFYGSTGKLSINKVNYNYYGIYLQFSTGSRSVFNNTIENNTFGIFTDSSAQSQIFNNNFINNTTQAQRANFFPPGDVFNLSAPLGGNYWSNYDTSAEGCNNINNDNFCDTPYTFIGGKDDLPWTKQDGWLFLDSDSDRIPDAQDACPNVPEEINGIQDQDGCPEPDLTVATKVHDPGNIHAEDLKAPADRHLNNVRVKLKNINTAFEVEQQSENGQVRFEDVNSGNYRILVTLGNENFEVFHDQTGPVAVIKEIEILNHDKEEEINFSKPADLSTNIGTDPDIKNRLDDLAIIYYHTQQVIEFEREMLGLHDRGSLVEAMINSGYYHSNERLLKVVAFDSTANSGAYYCTHVNECSPDHSIHFSNDVSDLGYKGRPMNREWHEVSHELMDLIHRQWENDGAELFDRDGGQPHQGYNNPTTEDSWLEGWATFFPLTIWDYFREKGEFQGPADFYRMGGRPTNMEDNLKAWDTDWGRIQREDFAAASLLWDLYDSVFDENPEGRNDIEFNRFSDQINLGANERERINRLWSIFTNPAYSILNIRNLWDVLKTEAIGAGDPDGDALDRLDDVFIMHGFFRDTDLTNKRYNDGEVVAYTCNTSGCTRPNTPFIFSANIQVNLTDQLGNPITDGTVVIETHYQSPKDFMDYTTELDILNLGNGTIYIEPDPEESNPTISVYVITPDGQRSDTLIFEGNVYRQKVEQASQTGSDVAISHTFTQGKQDQTTVVLLPPTALGATQDFGQVNLNWHYSPSPLVGKFNIYRKVNGGTFAKIGESITTSFSDPEATSGAVNTYAVTAVSIHNNESGQSNEVSVQTLAFGGFLAPLSSSEVFRLNSTIPVVFELKDQAGNPLTSAQAKLVLQKISDGLPSGDPIDATPTGSADSGNMFKVIDSRYQLNLDTRNLSTGTWQIKAQVNDGTSHTMEIGLK